MQPRQAAKLVEKSEIQAEKIEYATYNPAIPLHKQLTKMCEDGGTADLLGIPFTDSNVLFKPLYINEKLYNFVLNKTTEIDESKPNDRTLYLRDKLTFIISDANNKVIYRNISAANIEQVVKELAQPTQPKSLSPKL
jgi:hypothetical protein